MVTKPRLFDPNYYYHIYNRGIDGRNILPNDKDYKKFLDALQFYLYDQRIPFSIFEKLNREAKELYLKSNPQNLSTLRVKLICFCLMPNHFHLVLSPFRLEGATNTLSDITNSYTRYFNLKYQRVGRLFQYTFKSKQISDTESLLQVTRYIHINPIFSSKTNPNGKLKKADLFPFSSYRFWIDSTAENIIGDREEIFKWVKSAGGPRAYKEFVEAEIKAKKDPRLGIEHLILEKDI